MGTEYVERRDQGYWIPQTRVSLDSIVYAFLSGQTAESIAQSFPVLNLEQVYGAITYYLAHRSEIDRYLEGVRTEYEAQRQAVREADPMFYKKLADARQYQS
ncbi:MAG TPA: DUF433 domain-containing protein [Thermoanaerobaculia bacterium]|jgi:uncharacterized protein (DUF433 family)|nr:DUF433 domain-containing protein [Thermoanaerobaculia bacterium]